MQQGVNDLKQANNDIQQMLTTLETYATNNMQNWTGAARTQYTMHKQVWDKAMTNMTNILNTASTTLNNIHINFDDTENTNLKRWG